MTQRKVTFYPDHNPKKVQLGGTLIQDKDGTRIVFDNKDIPDFPGWSSRDRVLAMESYKMILEGILGDTATEFEKYKTPPNQMCLTCKELYKGFDKLIALEPNPRMHSLWRSIRDLLCYFLQEDTSYRFRIQLLLTELIDINKLKLTPSDEYWLGTRADFNYNKYKASKPLNSITTKDSLRSG